MSTTTEAPLRVLVWHVHGSRMEAFVRGRRRAVVDTRNLLDPDTLATAVFQHIGVGVPDQSREWTGAF